MKAGGVTTPLEARQGKAFLLLNPIREHYLLMKMGWYQDNRIKSNVIHVRLKDGKIWIEEDRTEDGIATDLLQAKILSSPFIHRVCVSLRNLQLRNAIALMEKIAHRASRAIAHLSNSQPTNPTYSALFLTRFLPVR